VRFGLPLDAMRFYFPGLYPEAATRPGADWITIPMPSKKAVVDRLLQYNTTNSMVDLFILPFLWFHFTPPLNLGRIEILSTRLNASSQITSSATIRYCRKVKIKFNSMLAPRSEKNYRETADDTFKEIQNVCVRPKIADA